MHLRGIRKYAKAMGLRLTGSVSARGWVEGLCPFAPWLHSSKKDTNPSFAIRIDEKRHSRFTCLACHRTGTLPNLAFQLATFDKRREKGLRSLGKRIERDQLFGLSELSEWDDAETSDASYADDKNNPRREEETQRLDQDATFAKYPFAYRYQAAIVYLSKRGIGYRTTRLLNLRYDHERQRIIFPIFDRQGHLVGLSGRKISNNASGPKVRDYPGLPKRRILLGGHVIRDGRNRTSSDGFVFPKNACVIVVEGLFDYARLKALGFLYVVAVLGSTLTPEKAKILEEWGLPVIWMVDNDQGGRIFLHGPLDAEGNHIYDAGALSMMYGKVPQFLVKYPKGRHDPGELQFAEASKMIEKARFYIRK